MLPLYSFNHGWRSIIYWQQVTLQHWPPTILGNSDGRVTLIIPRFLFFVHLMRKILWCPWRSAWLLQEDDGGGQFVRIIFWRQAPVCCSIVRRDRIVKAWNLITWLHPPPPNEKGKSERLIMSDYFAWAGWFYWVRSDVQISHTGFLVFLCQYWCFWKLTYLHNQSWSSLCMGQEQDNIQWISNNFSIEVQLPKYAKNMLQAKTVWAKSNTHNQIDSTRVWFRFVSSDRSSYSDDVPLYIRSSSNFFRFSLSPLMQLLLKRYWMVFHSGATSYHGKQLFIWNVR